MTDLYKLYNSIQTHLNCLYIYLFWVVSPSPFLRENLLCPVVSTPLLFNLHFKIVSCIF